MKFVETNIFGVYLVKAERHTDERGFFCRTWCKNEFEQQGLEGGLVQCSVSYNSQKGTLRGMHYQREPNSETKLVRCTRGTIFDVVVDIRTSSPSYGRWDAFELNQDDHHALYIPKGCAHGFQTLTDDCEVFYQMSQQYFADASSGFHYADPELNIKWPISVSIISAKDLNLPSLNDMASKTTPKQNAPTYCSSTNPLELKAKKNQPMRFPNE